MNNRQLELFIRVADLGSFSKAAAATFTTAASIMNQMNSLESYVGSKLLVRSTNGISLTPAGKYFYKGAQSILELSDEVISDTRQVERESQNSSAASRYIVRIGSSLLRPHAPLMRTISRNPNFYSQFDISIVSFDDSRIDDVLAHLGEDIDIVSALCDEPAWAQRCTVYPLGRVPFTVAVPRNHRLASKKILHVKDLYGEQLMIVKEGVSAGFDRIRAEMQQNHRQIEIAEGPEHYDLSTFNRCEKEGIIMLSFAMWREVHPSFVNIPVDWRYTALHGLLSPKQMTVNILRFYEALQDARDSNDEV